MLSYRHSFHAGNFADVFKHIVLVEILDHLIQKETPFEYIDTHSGAGLYSLKSADSQKLQEYSNGIGKLTAIDFPELARYFEVISSFNQPDELTIYPGSPSIGKYFLRPQDRAWLFELHPNDFKILRDYMSKSKKIRVHCQDGFEGLNAILPPASRRGLVLIDPSYEVKSDYDLVVNRIAKAYKKFNHGIYALWYPVVDRRTVDKLESKFVESGIKNIQRFELGLSDDTDERGMTASGMIVINPPWKLFDEMSNLLPKLAQQLGEKDSHFFKCDIISNE
ncbi:MAG: 23S rRNA (adenine2030-N6)-methyltransferase [Rhodothermales bacterium]